jgi:hypothetical protein
MEISIENWRNIVIFFVAETKDKKQAGYGQTTIIP